MIRAARFLLLAAAAGLAAGCAGGPEQLSFGRGGAGQFAVSGNRDILVIDQTGQPVFGAVVTMNWVTDDVNPASRTTDPSDVQGKMVLPIITGATYFVRKDGYEHAEFLGAALVNPEAGVPDYFMKNGVFTVVLRAKPPAK